MVNNIINVRGNGDLSYVEVYDMNGVLIYTGNENIISVPSAGLYLVKLGNKTHKVLVK